jgi:hypothetical protein
MPGQPTGIGSEQSVIGTNFPLSTLVSQVSVIPKVLYTRI